MRASLSAPFGAVHVTVDEDADVSSVDLSPEPTSVHVPAVFPDAVACTFEAYLAGEAPRPAVTVGGVEATAFQREVYDALTHLEPGQPATYGEIAERIERPGAARAVGQALRCNPLPLVWPCHRVVAADELGGFGGASGADETGKLAIKRWLLEHERERLAPR